MIINSSKVETVLLRFFDRNHISIPPDFVSKYKDTITGICNTGKGDSEVTGVIELVGHLFYALHLVKKLESSIEIIKQYSASLISGCDVLNQASMSCRYYYILVNDPSKAFEVALNLVNENNSYRAKAEKLLQDAGIYTEENESWLYTYYRLVTLPQYALPIAQILIILSNAQLLNIENRTFLKNFNGSLMCLQDILEWLKEGTILDADTFDKLKTAVRQRGEKLVSKIWQFTADSKQISREYFSEVIAQAGDSLANKSAPAPSSEFWQAGSPPRSDSAAADCAGKNVANACAPSKKTP